MLRWRSDADLVTDVPANRRIMPFLMRARAESAVLFEQKVDVARAQRALHDFEARTGQKATLLHLVLFALVRIFAERPRLNRFTAGARIWQRRGIFLSFSAKKAKSDDAPIVVVKRRFEPTASFADVVAASLAGTAEGRSDVKSGTDKELALFLALPAPMLSPLVRLLMLLDRWGLLPRSFIDGDPMFTSAFVANLGSLHMDAGFHHLYEYGSCPIFVMIGAAKPEVVAGDDGAPVVRELLTLRYTFDERIEDGLYCLAGLERLRTILEDPAPHLG